MDLNDIGARICDSAETVTGEPLSERQRSALIAAVAVWMSTEGHPECICPKCGLRHGGVAQTDLPSF